MKLTSALLDCARSTEVRHTCCTSHSDSRGRWTLGHSGERHHSDFRSGIRRLRLRALIAHGSHPRSESQSADRAHRPPAKRPIRANWNPSLWIVRLRIGQCSSFAPSGSAIRVSSCVRLVTGRSDALGGRGRAGVTDTRHIRFSAVFFEFSFL